MANRSNPTEFQINNMLDRALVLWELGFHVFPLGSPFDEIPPNIIQRFGSEDEARAQWPKTPRIAWSEYQTRQPTEEEIRQWWTRWPNANIALITGIQFDVIDADSEEAVEWCRSGVITRTPWENHTGRGVQFLYRKTDLDVRNSANASTKIDTRGVGGYIVAPGSTHANGTVYEAVNLPGSDVAGWKDLPALTPDDLVALNKFQPRSDSPVDTLLSGDFLIDTNQVKLSLDTEGVPEGSRNNKAARLVGKWINEGQDFQAVLRELRKWNLANTPPLPDRELERTAESVFKTHHRNHSGPNQKSAAVSSPVDNEVMPLRRPLPAAEPYPLEALGPVIGDVAKLVAEVEKIPPAIAAQCFLGVSAHAAQAHYDVALPFATRPISCSFLTVAQSGDGKSRVEYLAIKATAEWVSRMQDEWKAEFSVYKNKLDAYNQKRNSILGAGGKSSVEETEDKLTGLGESPEEPLKPTVLVRDMTYDALIKNLIGNYPSVFATSDEGGEFFGGHAMQKETRMRTISGLSKLWDSGEGDRTRVGDGSYSFKGKRLSSHLMIQPTIAEDVLSDDLLVGQGWLARNLVAFPESLAGTRMGRGSAHNSPELAEFHRCIRRLLEREPKMGDGHGELTPTALHLSKAAEEPFQRFSDEVEQQQGVDGPFHQVQPFAAKAAEHAARLACVMTAVEVCDANEIGLEQMSRAATLVRWYLAEAVRLKAVANIPSEIRLAELMENWLKKKNLREFYPALVYQKGPSVLRTKKDAEKAITAMLNHGRLQVLADEDSPPVEMDGQRRHKAYALVPEVFNGDL